MPLVWVVVSVDITAEFYYRWTFVPDHSNFDESDGTGNLAGRLLAAWFYSRAVVEVICLRAGPIRNVALDSNRATEISTPFNGVSQRSKHPVQRSGVYRVIGEKCTSIPAYDLGVFD